MNMSAQQPRVRSSSRFRPPSAPSEPPRSPSDDGKPPLEVVISFNTAGAYGTLPPESKLRLKNLVHCLNQELLGRLLSADTSSGTRIAIFAHGKKGKVTLKNYGIKWLDFTDDVAELTHFVDNASPLRWGSTCHCYELVLRKARSLSWTPRSRRALVLIGCTDTHYGLHPGSDELIHWSVEARCLAQMDVKVFAVEIKTMNGEHEFYRKVAEITEGCHVTVEQCTEMRDVITAIVSHLVGPECLEELEQEILDRPRECLTADLVRLFSSLRQHDDIVTSLYDESGPATPPGGDFDDEDDSDVEAVTSPSDEKSQGTTPALKRRSSLRLKQKKVSFFLPDRDDENSAQKTVTSSTSTVNVTENSTRPQTLRKSQTLPVQIKRVRRTGVAKPDAATLRVRDGSTSSETSKCPNVPALRRGVTSSCLGKRKHSVNGDLIYGEPFDAKVYTIDAEAPIKREDISPRAFTLNHLSWTSWMLVISPTHPEAKPDQWEPRLQNGLGGYRKKTIFTDSTGFSSGLYEVALKQAKGSLLSVKKRVVFHTFLSKLEENSSSWESQILGREDIQQEVSDAVLKKCSVFLRRATFSQTATRVQAVVRAALHRYDYAWNDVQGFKRKIRHIDFLYEPK